MDNAIRFRAIWLGRQLCQAAYTGDEVEVSRLLAGGAPPGSLAEWWPDDWVNEPQSLRRTPLHVAVERGHLGCALLLLKGGAPMDAADIFEFTPLHLAAASGRADCLSLLLEWGSVVELALATTAWTALHLAAMRGHTECVVHLVRAGASLDAVDAHGRTPLHCCAIEGRHDCLALLLRAGATVDVTDSYGATALDTAGYTRR